MSQRKPTRWQLLVAARDEWLASDEARPYLAGQASGEYLHNRMAVAFIAGYDAALRHEREEQGEQR